MFRVAVTVATGAPHCTQLASCPPMGLPMGRGYAMVSTYAIPRERHPGGAHDAFEGDGGSTCEEKFQSGREAANVPQNASPAPVVSTGLTSNDGIDVCEPL